MTDLELLREYAASNSEDAFATLVHKYTGLVYAAALRQAGDARDAEEITQAVFLILARKAGRLPAATILSGWLLRTTHFVALNARRKQGRRPQTEPVDPDRHATETDAAWHALLPLLDDALVTLNESNRNAISLRFFEGRSFKEIAGIMGLSEDAAQKRVSRALDLLRANLAKRGLALSSSLLVGAIGTHAIRAAPAQVVSAVTSAVAPGAVGTGNVATLMKLATEAMDAARRRVVLLRGGVIALIVLISSLALRWHASDEAPQAFQTPGNGQAILDVGRNRPVPPTGAAGSTQEAVRAGGMLLAVVDAETDRPVIGARITVRQSAGFPNSITNILTTDGNGQCRVPVDRTPAEDWRLYIEMLKDGYALQFANWSSGRGDLVEDIPTKYQARLVRGATIGGVVQNEKGEPMSGARVTLSVTGQTSDMLHQRAGLVSANGYHVEFTDAQGRWRCDHAPPQFDDVTFNVAHPDCIAAGFGVAKPGVQPRYAGITYLPEKDFRQQTATMVLKSGLVVDGLVVDNQGKPIVGAKVIENRDWRDSWVAHWTGTDGRFRLANVAAGELVVTVEADGFVAADKTIDPEMSDEELRFVLAPASILRGRVVDEAGIPLRAVVSAAGGDFETITPDTPVWTASEIRPARFEWSTTTDDEGRFEWRSAPPEHLRYTVYASGYESPQRLELAADGTEHVITLRRSNRPQPFRIAGNVTDAQTGKPVKAFQVWMGRSVEVKGLGGIPTRVLAAPALQTTGEEGRFGFPCGEPASTYTLQIKAEGYVAANLEIPGPLTNNCRFDFRLAREEPASGTVLTPDGMPASGAVVAASSGQANVSMSLPGRIQAYGAHTTSDAQGYFVFPSMAEVKKIIITHTNGYAELTYSQLSFPCIITLQPWGRVEGVLRSGGQPGGGEKVILCNRPGPLPWSADLLLNLRATADSQGRFVIEKVPPGAWQISRMLISGGVGNETFQLTQRTPIEVTAGHTTHVTLGGTGWKVVGSIEFGALRKPANWRGDFSTLRQKSSSSLPYALVFDTNGVFTIEDVPPGTYELNIVVTAPGLSGGLYDENFVGSLHKDVILPELPPGGEPKPFDVGTLDLQPVERHRTFH